MTVLRNDPLFRAAYDQAVRAMVSNQREHAVHLIAGAEAVLENRAVGLCQAVRSLTPVDVQSQTAPRSHVESIRVTFHDVQKALYEIEQAVEHSPDFIGP